MINMKTNLFRVREKKEKRIIIEEERLKNPFLLFLKRHKNFILLSGIMIAICLILISTGVAFSLFRGSNDYDISYIEGDEVIDSNNNPELDDDDIKDELLGEIAREEGIVLQTKTFMSAQGDVISYFTDGTSLVVQSNGKIYRISTNDKGEYGVNENGKVSDTATKILVTSTTSTLMDGTIVTNYSDGTAKVEHKNQTYFVRDSNNVKITNGSLDTMLPSGVAPTKETTKVSATTLKKFTDNTSLIMIGNQKYIVNKNTKVTTTETNIDYSKPNSFNIIEEKIYKDGYTISFFANGSAVITDKDGSITYVKKSGDILLQKNKLYEILPNPTGHSYSRTTLNIANDKKVTYFDNGAAIIINKDGTRQYIDDNEDIIFDDNRNINSNPTSYKQISEGKIDTGEKAYSFSNGKTQVITENGKSYVVDTDRLTFIKEEEDKDPEEEKPSHDDPLENPGEGIYISEAENVYNDFRNVENTKFIIRNNNNEKRILRITIEEVNNYRKYNTDRLPPQFVKFQATIGDTYISARPLTQNTWRDEDGRTNYVIYDGTINAKETKQIALALYVDYAPLDNSYQNKGFIGTIRVYVEDGRTR